MTASERPPMLRRLAAPHAILLVAVGASPLAACINRAAPERSSAAASATSARPVEEPATMPPASPIEAKARQLVDKLSKRAFGDVVASFDDTMRAALGTAALGKTWDGLIAQAGALKSCGRAISQTKEQWRVIVLDCHFERTSLGVQFTFDSAERVSGLFFRPFPAQSAHAASPSAAADAFDAREVAVGADPWRLPGTLTLPKGRKGVAAIVLVHGSGPNDRDETIGPNKPFRDLAEGLASRGIAVLRYEKRSRIHGERMAALPAMTVNDEVVDDALAAVRALRGVPEIAPDRIFVVGHSLGGTLAPRIAQRDPKIAGIVLLAGATRPLGDAMLDQMRYIASLDGTVSAQELAQIQEVERAWQRVLEITRGARHDPAEMLLGAPPSYWIDLLKYDAPATAKALSIPIFVLQGQRDYQVTSVDLDGWKHALASRSAVTFKVYPTLNHLFMAGTGKSTPSEYEQSGHVDEAVVRDIAEWVAASGTR